MLATFRSVVSAKGSALAGRSFTAPIAGTSPSRLFHGSSVALGSQRALELSRIRRDIPHYGKIEIDTKQVLEALRSLRAERAVNGHPDKAAFYSRASYNASYLAWQHTGRMLRDGLRDISLAAVGKSKVTLAEIETVLSEENGVAWTLLKELAQTGRCERLDLLDDEERAAVLFNRVHGMGRQFCWAYAKNGARTLDDLRERTREKGPIQLGLDHFEDMEVMIPRQEIIEFKTLFEEVLAKEAPDVKFEIMGSFRRGEELSSDIDMVIWHPAHPKRLPGKLSDKEKDIMGSVKRAFLGAGILHAKKLFSDGDQKVMALTKLDKPGAVWRQVDIRLCPTESLPYMLLGNTGDDNLMRFLRMRAKHRNLVLNEYCMGKRKDGKEGKQTTSTWPVEGTEVIVKEEREIFEHLDIPYLEPSQRSYRVYQKLGGIKF